MVALVAALVFCTEARPNPVMERLHRLSRRRLTAPGEIGHRLHSCRRRLGCANDDCPNPDCTDDPCTYDPKNSDSGVSLGNFEGDIQQDDVEVVLEEVHVE